MVKTKCVYDPPEVSDGDRILVTRYWPRPLSKRKVACTDWLRELTPSKELLQDWKEQTITWQEYVLRYHEEMWEQQAAIKDLPDRAKRGTITLICFEPEDDPCCTRYLLKDLIERVEQIMGQRATD